ncbi:MAG: hypothetical protein K8S23_01585 [Candidatus Cloacimonetes bacterium]|nr:hypothetical protein [Candidatus Cloacimonadota bacterium]
MMKSNEMYSYKEILDNEEKIKTIKTCLELVPLLCVGTLFGTLCIRCKKNEHFTKIIYAECHQLHSNAEHWNEIKVVLM